MRKLIYGINVSLDGCCDHTKFGGSDDILDYFRELLHDTDLIIYGRKTYQLMVPFWPDLAQAQAMNTAANAYAKTFSSIKRVVVSKTLSSITDTNATILRENIQNAIIKLKQQPGKSISIGGVDFPGQVIAWGLVDEFHIVVHPLIVGEGRRLFSELNMQENLGLKLQDTTTLTGGAIVLRYIKQ